MMRTLYLLGSGYLAVCVLLLLAPKPARPQPQPTPPHHTTPPSTGSAPEWFTAMKPFCNAVEVQTRIEYQPPPSGLEGAGYGAACYALAGKIDEARGLILGLPEGERAGAAGIVFNIGHPVADAGDDKSAGPIMELVLEFCPDNYMAQYHAGMSEYVLGLPDLARTHLRTFLQQYQANDGWRQNALEVLGRLEGPERN